MMMMMMMPESFDVNYVIIMSHIS